MTQHSSRSRILGLIFAVALAIGLSNHTFATTYYWNVTGTNTWFTTSSWSTNSTGSGGTGAGPGSGDTAVFNGSSFNGTTVAQLSGAQSVNGLTFNNTGSTTLDSSSSTAETLTIGGGGITIASGAGAVTLGDPTNKMNIAISGSQTWTNSSTTNTLTDQNGLTSSATSGTQTLSTAGGGNITFNGVIGNGSTGGTVALTLGGTGTVTLAGANTYTGATLISGGILSVSNSTALKTSDVTDNATLALGSSAATLNSLSGSGSLTTSNAFTIGAGSGSGSTISATYSGTVTSSSGGNFNFNLGTGQTQTFTGAWTFSANEANGFIVNSGTVVLGSGATLGTSAKTLYDLNTSGSGNLTINSGAFAYGPLFITQASTGTLTIDSTLGSTPQGGTISSGTLVVGSGGNLSTGQNFNVNGTGVFNINSGGTVSAGNILANGGTGTVNLNAGGTVSGGSIQISNGTTFTEASTGVISGGVTLSLSNGTAQINSSSNTTNGQWNVNQGTLNDNVTSGGLTTGSIYLGSTSLTGVASILTTVSGATISNTIYENGNGTTTQPTTTDSIGGNQSSGTSTYTGNINLVSLSSSPTTTTLTAASGGEIDFTTGAINGSNANLAISGGGTVKLTGANGFGSSTAGANSVTVSGGTTLMTTNAGNNLGASGNTLIFNNGTYKFASALDLSTRTIQFSSGGGTFNLNGNNVSFANAIGNSGTGGGGLTLINSGSAATLTLNGQNTYTGGTTITTGTLVAGVSTSGSTGALGSTSGSLTDNSSLDLHTTNQAVGNFTGGSAGLVYNNGSGTSTLTIGTGTATGGNFQGVIENNTGSGGTVALTKVGSGTITLSGNNTYTGATSVSAGVLAIASGTPLGATPITLSGTGTLLVGTSGSSAATTIGVTGTGGSLTVNTGSTLSLASSTSGGVINNLDINGVSGATGLTLGGGGTITLDLSGGSASQIVLGSGLLASATGTTTINFNLTGNVTGGSSILLISSAGGLTNLGTNFTSGGVVAFNGFSSGGYVFTLSETGSNVYLTENATSNAYWTGNAGTASWATNLPNSGSPNSNFSTDSGGVTNRQNALDSLTTVYFAASGASSSTYANTTLGQNTSIAALDYTVGGVGISGTGGYSLTIAGGGINVGSSLSAETISSNVVLGATQTWTIGSGSALAVSGNITGSGIGLTEIGGGTLTLTGTNGYTGATIISSGILNAQSVGALGGTSSVTVSATGAALQLQGGLSFTSPALTLSGTGVSSNGALENVSGNNTYSGAITLAAPATIGSDANTLTLNSSTAIGGGGFALTLTGAGNGAISSAISTGSGSLTMSGSGLWSLSGANTYTGGTTISSGTLQLSGSGTLGVNGSTYGALAVNGGLLDLNGVSAGVAGFSGSGTVANNGTGTSTLTIGNNSGTGTFSGALKDNSTGGTGILALTKTGSGTITLSGTNTYSGATAVTGGNLNLASAGAATGSGITVSSGAALQLTGTGTTTNAVGLTLSGTGTGTAGALESVSGTNTYTGALTIGSGGATIGVDAGSLILNSATAIGGTGNLTIVGGSTTTTTISSAIGTGAGSLTMSSSGTLNLGGSNTYTGGTTLNSGVLNYSSATNFDSGTGSISINAATTGSTLNYTGSGSTVANNLNFSGGNSVYLGNSGTGAIVYSGTVSTGSGGETIQFGNSGGSDVYGGTLSSSFGSSANPVTLIQKNGNATWILSGANDYVNGQELIYGGVLQVTNTAAADFTGTMTLLGGTLQVQGAGSGTSETAYFKVSGVGTGTPLGWSNNGGFAAIGGNLTLNIASGNQLTWAGGTYSIGAAGIPISFGSSTSDSQVILPNAINLNESTANAQQTINVTKGTGTDSAVLSGVLSDGPAASGLIKTGTGTLILSNTNTYTGPTTVNGGTLQLAVANAIHGPSSPATSVTVNTGGTLLFSTAGTTSTSASGAINNTNANVALNGVTTGATPTTANSGEIKLSGSNMTETMGALTLTGNTIIDFGSGDTNNTLQFSSLTLSGSSNTTLSIYNWSGNPYVLSGTDNGTVSQDRLLFGSSTGLSGTISSQILFYSDSGSTLIDDGSEISFSPSGGTSYPHEVAPVPEPSTIFGGLCLLGLLGWRSRRQILLMTESQLVKLLGNKVTPLS